MAERAPWQEPERVAAAAPLRLDELRTIDLFDGLTDEELDRWLAAATPFEVQAGEQIVEENTSGLGVQLLFAGTARTLLIRGDRVEPVGEQQAPTWMGAITALTGTSNGARIVAETPCRLANISTEAFTELTLASPVVHRRVMEVVAPVMQRVTAIDQNRERLASLGTMAAGLAHELNNPAAAAQRAAAQLQDALESLNHTLRRFVEAGVSLERARMLLGLHDEVVAGAASRSALDALDAADAEEEVLAALEDAGVDGAWKVAEPLAVAGADAGWVARVVEAADGAAPVIEATVSWVAASLTAGSLADELKESTRRMTDLVGAVKSYTYMDQGDVQELDVHEGIETTITVLGHKLRHTSIEIRRDYDRSLPRLMARGPELTQVWTNLLDNAIDALGERGTISIRTQPDHGCVRVEVTDDGPGIPPDVLPRVFETFFTTKEVGAGTGLGLATAHRIIEQRHGGSLTVDSEPGRTTFTAWIPVGADRSASVA